MTNEATDRLGNAFSSNEPAPAEIYTRLKAISQREDLPPVATANAKQAMVMMWNACNDLALICEEPGCD